MMMQQYLLRMRQQVSCQNPHICIQRWFVICCCFNLLIIIQVVAATKHHHQQQDIVVVRKSSSNEFHHDHTIIQQQQQQRRLRKSKSYDAVNDEELEYEKFTIKCQNELGPDAFDGILSQTRFAMFLYEYCNHSNTIKGTNCKDHKEKDAFNSIPFDLQLVFVYNTCPTADNSILQIQCLQYLIESGDPFYFEGQLNDLCQSSFTLLKESNIISFPSESDYIGMLFIK